MLLRIFLSLWALWYIVSVAVESCPFDDSLKKACLFVSSYIWGIALLTFIWAPIIH